MEASFLETQFCFGMPVTTAHGRPFSVVVVLSGLVQDGELHGVAKLVWWCSHLWWRSGVISLCRCGCWQRTMAAGVARQLSVRCGAASGDGACGIDIMRRLGLQRIAAGGSALLDYFGVNIVGRRCKRLPWLAGMARGSLFRGWCNEVMSVSDWGMAVLWRL